MDPTPGQSTVPQPPAAGRRLIRLGWRTARLPLAAYLVILLVMLFLENRLVFLPVRYPYPEGAWRPSGVRYEEVEFSSFDGTPLHGWYLPHPAPRAYVLFAHGNGGNITYWTDDLRIMQQELGVAAFAFDYRGYGRSGGSPSEAGVLADARAARAWLAERAGIAESEIVLWGMSLGGGVAVDLAAADGARGLILQNTFSTLPDAAAIHYPFLPVQWLMRTRFDSLAKISNYRGPLLQTHGDCDEIVPLTLGRRLFEAAAGPKRFVACTGAGHNDPLSAEFLEAMDEFFDSLPTGDNAK